MRGKFQSSSGDMCALQEPLGDIDKIEMYALLFIIIIIIIIIIYNSILCPIKQKEKMKKITLPTMWK